MLHPHKHDTRIDRSFVMWTFIGLIAASIAAALIAGAVALVMTGQKKACASSCTVERNRFAIVISSAASAAVDWDWAADRAGEWAAVLAQEVPAVRVWEWLP